MPFAAFWLRAACVLRHLFWFVGERGELERQRGRAPAASLALENCFV